MAGAPVKEETVLVRMRVSKKLYAYLKFLRTRTTLGASENDIANYLLTQKVEQMIAEKYHHAHKPPDDDDDDDDD